MLRRVKRALGRALCRGILGVFLFVVLINGAVRTLGGSPALLSPFGLPAKIDALGRLAKHELRFALERDPDVETTIRDHASRKGLPPDLVLAIARRESGLSKRRVSHTGAMGVMQLMPATAEALGVEDPFSVEESVDGATRLLATHWRRYSGDQCRVAAAYNAGPGRVPRRGKAVDLPGETRHYLMHVIGPSCRRLYR